MRRRDDLDTNIRIYWDERSESYSRGVLGELADWRHAAWRNALDQATEACRTLASQTGRVPRVLDVGCGPGFFSVLMAELGCEVDAVDASDEMLAQARANISACVPDARVRCTRAQIDSLPFGDATFDAVVSRNVTWLMREPEATYAEWLRVLRPGGRLVAFDANWYRYLVDEELNRQRVLDQTGRTVEEWGEDARATTAEERRCEELAASLPLTSVLRPAWDVEALRGLGVSDVWADESVWERLWTPSEQRFYGTSPQFLVAATKEA